MQNMFITAFIAAIMGSSALVIFYSDRDETLFTTTVPSVESVQRLSESNIHQRVTGLQPAVKALTELKSHYSYPVHPNRINKEDTYSLTDDDPLPNNESWEDSYVCLHFPDGHCPQNISIVSYGDFQTQNP
ncbi:hypothetical protein THII_3868 [Thioploca ingrica]|uniref:Uncharacterized protein n=1 Tax=Thioploca ingrica TaxID=40754 RepID=A0A090AR04_9GAMM|nr:hypothetical protein THII_3868 [Thioploca ingrica]